MTNKTGHRQFGNVRKLPSGRFQARYAVKGKSYAAKKDGESITFQSREDAQAWLKRCRELINHGEWSPSGTGKGQDVTTLRTFAEGWLSGRDLAVRTREHYAQLLRDHVYPTLGDSPITTITAPAVRAWHSKLSKTTGPTARAHSYGLLRTILHTAVDEEVIPSNPCRVRAGGQSKRAVKIRPATLPELETITQAMPEKYRLMILLASWCGLRQGELFELRRSDVNGSDGVINIRRGVVRTESGRLVKDPKSDAGKRTVSIPPHLMSAVTAHLKDHAQIGAQGLLFPAGHGGQLAPSTLYKVFYPAREKAGRPDLRFHDLRHTGAVLAASTGATLAELMARLGHSTPAAAMRYQHAAQDRDRVIADALSQMVTSQP